MRHTLDIERLVKEAAGNHRKFESFCWDAEPEDGENWTLVYTNNRDSGLSEQSNAAAIEKEMVGFADDVIPQHHGHWACGWVDGYAIRVYRADSEGTLQITEAFRRWCDLHDALEDYPVLDETDYSQREYDAAHENIRERSRFVVDDHPEDWDQKIWEWLWENEQGELENVDDQGAYPSDESIRRALRALDLLDRDYWPEQAIRCKCCGHLVGPSDYGNMTYATLPYHHPFCVEGDFAELCEEKDNPCLGSAFLGIVEDVEG